MKKRIAIVVLAMMLLATFALAGCGQKAAEADVIRIGVFEPLTGANAAGGQMELEGIKTAHSLVGEVLGKKIELIEMDNKSDDVEAVTAAERLIKEGADIVIGSWGSSVAIAAGPTFLENETPAIGTSCTNPLVTKDNDYYFRVCYLDDFQGTLLANYAKDELGAKTAAILCDVSDTYAIGLRQYFVEAFGEENIVAEANFNKGDQDFTAQLTSVMEKNPDVIFAPSGYTEAGLLMRQAHDLGYEDVLFLGGDTWETEPLIEVGGDAVSSCRFTTFFDAEADATEESAKFLEAYAALYNGAKPKGAVTALGYDAYMAAVAAIEAAGTTDGPALRDALAALSITGVTGSCKFDENGDAIKDQAIIKTVEDGAFKYITTYVIK